MRNLFPSGDTARYAAIVVGLGSACLAIAVNRTAIGQLLDIDLSLIGNKYFLYATITCLVMAGIIILLWLIGLLVRHTLIVPAQIVAEKLTRMIDRFDNIELQVCAAADLDEISRLSAAEFGPLAASHQRNLRLFGLDEQSYWKVIDKAGGIVGFYTLFRLTAAGTRAIARGDFAITTCPVEYLRKDKKYFYKTLYVAAMFGKNKKARAMVWGALNQRVVELRPKNVFARAATEDGLRLLEKASFSPVQADKPGVGALYRK
jgi:hypothetical protein